LDYKPKGGETWPQVKNRAIDFFGSVKDGNYLLFTHGGMMCCLTSDLGIKDVLPNCSCVGLRTNEKNTPEKLIFKWIFEEPKQL